MPNYIEVIGNCFVGAEAYTAGDPTVYANIVWVTAPIAQATLDASECAQFDYVKSNLDNAVVFTFDHDRLKSLSWLGTGGTKTATAGYTIPQDATVVGISYHVESGVTRGIDLYINGTLDSTLITVSPGDDSSTSLNVTINKNDKIQLRSADVSGITTDIVVSLYLQWR